MKNQMISSQLILKSYYSNLSNHQLSLLLMQDLALKRCDQVSSLAKQLFHQVIQPTKKEKKEKYPK